MPDELVKEVQKISRMLSWPRSPRARERVTHAEGGPMKTKQSLRDGTDINKIMDRWLKHGTSVAHLNPHAATYGDFSSGLDYSEALNAVKAAEADFAALPARVRAKCGNDPAEFLQIVFDPERRDELEGLDIGHYRKREGDPPRAAGPGGPTDPVKQEAEKPKEAEVVPPEGEKGVHSSST